MGRILSKMVMPNISAFIAWGLLTALFNQDGWLPNAHFAAMIDPMIQYVLPLLIAYTGGKNVYGSRGGVIGVVATVGLIVGAEIPMFIGAMLMGPLSAWLLEAMDKRLRRVTPTGFEMLSNNFSAGILGLVLMMAAYGAVGPMIVFFNHVLSGGVNYMINHGLLFLASILIEPAKVLFLNNAINHGILGPMGMQEALKTGQSTLFLLEANPGPGLGILLAYFYHAKGRLKESTHSAMVIHFLGGIHEIYFPYVLMTPFLLLALIAGGMSGVLIFQLLGVGLVATPSPGSIFSIITMTPRHHLIGVLIGIATSTVVTFIVSGIILSKKDFEIENQEESDAIAQETDQYFQNYQGNYHIQKIVFACDAGMGSSAMGASMLQKVFKEAGLMIQVDNASIDDIPKDADAIVTFKTLLPLVKGHHPKALHIGVTDFMNKKQYEMIAKAMMEHCEFEEVKMSQQEPTQILLKTNILLGQASVSKEDAIKQAGKLLYDSGYVEENYIEGMLAREEKFSTYIGSHVAIPHGENAVKDSIKASGIVVIQYPEGIHFGEGKEANLVIGIAGKGNEHLQLLANIAEAIEDEDILDKMLHTTEKDYIYSLFSDERMFEA